MLVIVAGKLAHQTIHQVPCVVAIVSLDVAQLKMLTLFFNLVDEVC